MKLNILKFQSGGTGLGSLFSAIQVGAPNTSEESQSTSSSSSSSDPILSKETLNKLRSLEYGLPNELDQFEVELAALELKLDSGRRVSPREIANIRAKAGRIIALAGHLKRAEQSAEKNGYLDDIAIDAKGVGYIYALTDKGIEKVAFSKYNPEKHEALTYGDLVEYRRQSPQLINDADIISAINKGTGVEQANDYIMKILDAVKSTGSKQEAYESLSTIIGKENARRMSTMDHAAIRDIALMADNIGLDTLFKTTRISNDENLQHALSYLVSTLPKSMLAQLQAHYMVNMGGTYKDSKTHVGELLYSSVLMKRDDGFLMDYQLDLNTAAGTTGGKKASRDTRKISNLEKLAAGSANRTELEFIVPKATGMKITFHGSGLPTLYNSKDEMVGPTTVLEAYNSGLRGMSPGKIYFGDKRVDEGMLNDFLYDGQTIIKASIPVDMEGAPSFRLLEKLDKVFLEFSKHPEWNLQLKNNYLKQQEIPGYINEQGNYVGDGLETEDFFIISAYTTKKEADRNYDLVEDNDFVHIINRNSSEHAALMSRLQSTIEAVNGSRDKNDPKVELDTYWWLRDPKNPLVSAPLFIQCSPNPAARGSEVTGNNPEVDTQYWEESVVKDQAAGKGGPHYDTSKMV